MKACIAKPTNAFDQARDEIVERLITRLEAIDEACGLTPAYDYDTLRRRDVSPAIIIQGIGSTINQETSATRIQRRRAA